MPAPPEPAQGPQRVGPTAARTLLDPEQPDLFEERPGDWLPSAIAVEETALGALPTDAVAIEGESTPRDEPLFGMHNRDYPSLWAARRLVDYQVDGAVSFEAFSERATEDAWAFAETLRSLEAQLGTKLTALFPTNREKRQAASDAFRVFAIGVVTSHGLELHSEGPLFQWGVIDVFRRDGALLVGVTEPGRGLLERLEKLTVRPPHDPRLARIFLEHLRECAPSDWWGFQQTLDIVTKRPTRIELLEAFRIARPDWRESVAATTAQGYIARAREWGLIAPKVVDGRYELTEFGAELAGGTAE
jgi:hypothetical protein